MFRTTPEAVGKKPLQKFPRYLLAGAAALIAATAMTCVSAYAADGEDYDMHVSKDKPPPPPDHWKTCAEAKSAEEIMVHVNGIKSDKGNIRVQLYDDNPDHFLAKGWKLYRSDVPVTGDTVDVCIPVPKPGLYALVAIHDANKNGEFDIFSEGFGFSNNPKVHFSAPAFKEAAFEVKPGVTNVDVKLNYIFGGRKKPVRRGGRY